MFFNLIPFRNIFIKVIFIGILSIIHTNPLWAQDKFALGASGMYNFPLNSIGFGIRGQIPIVPRVHIVPQVKYAPSFNQIHELYGGINAHYLFIATRNYSLYAAAGAQFNRWLNYTETQNTKSKMNNFLPEVGAGASAGGKIIGAFAEFKYNILWNESYAEIGILLFPGGVRRHYTCPTYY